MKVKDTKVKIEHLECEELGRHKFDLLGVLLVIRTN